MSFIEMRMEEHYSYLKSISNLAMLKIFHDAGVDVKKRVEVFMTDIQFNHYTDFEIFHECSLELFEDIKSFGYNQESSAVYENNQSATERYPALVNEQDPEHTFILHHSAFKEVLESDFSKELKEYFDKQVLQEIDGSMELLPDNTGIFIAIHFPGDMHEIAYSVVMTLLKAKELKKELEDENGLSNKDIRSVA